MYFCELKMKNLDLGFQCVKYILCTVNSLFLLIGLMIFIIGAAMHAIFNDFSRFLAPSCISPATILILAGFFILVTALLGCYSTIRENASIIFIVTILLSLLLLVECVTIMSLYILRNDVKDALISKINTTISEYETNIDAKFAMDFLQSSLECCGSNNFEDWSNVINNTINGLDVPRSCCVTAELDPKYLLLVESTKKTQLFRIENRLINYDACRYIYRTGCIENLFGIIYRKSFFLSISTTGLIIIQVIIVSFMYVLGRAIQLREKEKDRTRMKLPAIFNSFEWLDKPVQSQFFESQLQNINCLANT